MTQNDVEQRHFSRIPFDCDATIIHQSEHWSTQLLDISLNGALVIQPENWQASIGDEYQLHLKLSDSDIIIMEQAIVAHTVNNRIGFRCKIIDIDSITYLKRLVEMNLGDPELVNRELAALGDHSTQ